MEEKKERQERTARNKRNVRSNKSTEKNSISRRKTRPNVRTEKNVENNSAVEKKVRKNERTHSNVEKNIVVEKKTRKTNKQNVRSKNKEEQFGFKRPKLRIIPLGGLHEIGKNITVFEYGDEMIAVDCGLSFPEDDMLGVDLVIPDITYILNNKEKFKGLHMDTKITLEEYHIF